MNKFDTLYQSITETSLSRFVQHVMHHDAGTITAYREYENGYYDEQSRKYYDLHNNQVPKLEKRTYSWNLKLNKELKNKLKDKGYGLFETTGFYQEVGMPRPSLERVLVVVDLKDSGKLEKDLTDLGESYQQDTVLFIPRGVFESADGKFNNTYPYIIGTNHVKDNYAGGYHKKKYFKSGYDLGNTNSIIKTLLGGKNGRPFTFKESQ